MSSMTEMTVGKVGSNFGNGKGRFYANSADYSANVAAMLAIGLPPPRLPMFMLNCEWGC